MKKKSVFPDARALEDAFFTKENARLLEQLKEKQKREALREVVQIKDETFLDRLIELGIGPETVLALTLVPLIAVAWADGTLDSRERDAVPCSFRIMMALMGNMRNQENARRSRYKA